MDSTAIKKNKLIGSGVWGCVYDLNDGTVIKLAREDGGIGNGADKLAHEAAMMTALAAANNAAVAPLSFTIPALYDTGRFERDADGFSLWLRSYKVPGKVHGTASFQGMKPSRRAGMLVNMAHALAQFHTLIARAELKLSSSPIWDEMKRMDLSPADRTLLERFQNLYRAGVTGPLVPLHGDFNITNIMWDDSDHVSGVLDFAEMCIGAPAEDLAALVSEFPDERDLLVKTYEEHAEYSVSDEALTAALRRQDLLSLLIARYRHNDTVRAAALQEKLDKALVNAESFYSGAGLCKMGL